MYKIESIKVAFHSKKDMLTEKEIKELEDDGWELQYLVHPSEAPLLKSVQHKIKA